MKSLLGISLLLVTFLPNVGLANEPALLLFDGLTGTEFAGCLNCQKFDAASVCNRFGDYGSQFGEPSIWNRFGKFGSRYEPNSPWNPYGSGLRIVDEQGNYYGLFTASHLERSTIPVVTALIDVNESMGDLQALRNLYCE